MTASLPVVYSQSKDRDSKIRMASDTKALALARILNKIAFIDLPPAAVKHAKIILASTLLKRSGRIVD